MGLFYVKFYIKLFKGKLYNISKLLTYFPSLLFSITRLWSLCDLFFAVFPQGGGERSERTRGSNNPTERKKPKGFLSEVAGVVRTGKTKTAPA